MLPYRYRLCKAIDPASQYQSHSEGRWGRECMCYCLKSQLLSQKPELEDPEECLKADRSVQPCSPALQERLDKQCLGPFGPRPVESDQLCLEAAHSECHPRGQAAQSQQEPRRHWHQLQELISLVQLRAAWSPVWAARSA